MSSQQVRQTTRYLQLNSSTRNREQYPNPAYFEVPFAPSVQNISPLKALDPIVDGVIYYKFTLSPQSEPAASGIYKPGSSSSYILLDPGQTPTYINTDGFYVGYYIQDVTSGEINTIRSFTGSNGVVTLDQPFQSITAGNTYNLYAGYPDKMSVYIPSVDDNGNTILRYELAYNGYYLIFETSSTLYSNSTNSNIYYRQISYYDYITQIAYFTEKLDFDPTLLNGPITFTLRKSLPLQRWTLNTPTYVNMTPPTDPLIGPLIGPVITLPSGANEMDNYYKGKYVYFSSNSPEFYSPPLPLPSQLINPVPYIFYPIYGAFYVKAYNGKTRELSVSYDIGQSSKTRTEPPSLPTYKNIGYNSSNFYAEPFEGFDSVSALGGGVYRGNLTVPIPPPIPVSPYSARLGIAPILYEPGRTYQVSFTVLKSPNIISSYIYVNGVTDYYSPSIQDVYTTFNFSITPQYDNDLFFTFYSEFDPNNADPKYFQWNSFHMIQQDTINICSFIKDNFSPLSYNGTIVSTNQPVCYEIGLSSLSLPNYPLLTGSKIAFYPFIYVELCNVTSASAHSNQIIYSNEPHSNRALFIPTVFPSASPDIQAYIALSGGMNQTVKFKPNDNLRLAIYLPDGTLFQTIIPDTLSPYPPNIRVQVNAIFSILRMSGEYTD